MEIVGVAARSFDGLEVGRSFDVAVPMCAEPLVRGRSAMDRGDLVAQRDGTAAGRGDGGSGGRAAGAAVVAGLRRDAAAAIHAG